MRVFGAEGSLGVEASLELRALLGRGGFFGAEGTFRPRGLFGAESAVVVQLLCNCCAIVVGALLEFEGEEGVDDTCVGAYAACAYLCGCCRVERAMLVCETIDFGPVLAAKYPGNVVENGKLVLEAGNVMTVGKGTYVVCACTQTVDGKKVKYGTIVVYGQTLAKMPDVAGFPNNVEYVHMADKDTAVKDQMVEVFVTEPYGR